MQKRPPKPRDEIFRWGVYLLRKKAERIGSVEARDQDAARQHAIEVMAIEKRDHFRVSVLPEQ